MKFKVDKSLFEQYPELKVGCVILKGIDCNTKFTDEINILLDHEVALINEKFCDQDIQDIVQLKPYRRYFEQEATDKTSSVESLVTRILSGSKVSVKNSLVNLYNTVSLKHIVPLGGHDLDQIDGDIVLGELHKEMSFREMGQSKDVECEKDEICYYDNSRVLTRHWMWRQSDIDKISSKSRNVMIPIDVFKKKDHKKLENIIMELTRLCNYYFGGEVESYILDGKNTECEIGQLEKKPIPYHKTEQDKIIDSLLDRGVMNIYPSREFLKRELMTRKVSIYLGIDPTGPALHIGHAISLMRLKMFQELGHKVFLLIGNFTAQIGDPTDKGSVRKPLDFNQVMENCENYKKQASKILSFEGINPVEFVYNNDWLSKMSFSEIIDLSSNFTVQQMLERDMFDKRIKESKPVFLHEFLYPLMQGYDSVHLNIDGEIGGNDQTFNMLAGRTLVKKIQNNRDKFVITVKILADTSGEKMGKTTGNMIRLDDTPEEMYGSVMSWTDGMILSGLELCTFVPEKVIEDVKQSIEKGANPRDSKMLLAREIVGIYYSESDAEKAEQGFINQFQKKEIPDDIEEYTVLEESNLIDIIMSNKLVSSRGDAKRLAAQNAIKIDEEIVTDVFMPINPKTDKVLRVGKKKFLKLV